MNIKKYSLKTMCAALACTTVLSSMLAAYATDVIINETPMDDSAEINVINTLADDSAGTDTGDSGWTTEENSYEDIKVTYQHSSSYAVTIPKTIALDSKKQATYSVKVTGDIDANQRVYVAPVDGIADSENLDFYMKDLSGKKADVAATVTHSKTYWSSEDVTDSYEETQNCVSAPDLTAGTWEGTFQVEIRLETEKEQEHTHNYVDGKCDCGAIDPNHTHDYVDGTCTICGKETDPYETAPASAYSNWNYILDDENNIITLNYYIGSETNVIVYANYVINGKTYKTQLASNSADATSNTKYMFNGCKYFMKSVKFSKNIDTSNVTDMSYMFYYCEKLEELDISGFDTGNVINMRDMFFRNLKLKNLDVTNFDTSKVTNMSEMFYQCAALESLDVSNFNTSSVTDMSSMFAQCNALASLDLRGWNTSNVTNMMQMFQQSYGGNSSLRSLDLSSFDTSNVTNMMQMFRDCEFLTSLDLGSFDTGNVANMSCMFYNTPELKTIYVSQDKWSTSLAESSICTVGYPGKIGTYQMFSGCGASSVIYK